MSVLVRMMGMPLMLIPFMPFLVLLIQIMLFQLRKLDMLLVRLLDILLGGLITSFQVLMGMLDFLGRMIL